MKSLLSRKKLLKKVKILAIDDESFYLSLLKRKLTNADKRLEVVTTTSVDEALKLMEDEKFSCILCDHQLNGTITVNGKVVEANGVNFIRKVNRLKGKNKNYNCPIVLITGKGSEEIASEAMREGASGYFIKRAQPGYFKIIALSIREIITKFETEEKLKMSEKRLRTILDDIHEGIWITNLDNITTFVNRPLLNLLGYKEEEMIGKHIKDFMPQEDFAIVKKITNDRIANKDTPTIYSIRLINHDGSIINIKAKGGLIIDRNGIIAETYGIITLNN